MNNEGAVVKPDVSSDEVIELLEGYIEKKVSNLQTIDTLRSIKKDVEKMKKKAAQE